MKIYAVHYLSSAILTLFGSLSALLSLVNTYDGHSSFIDSWHWNLFTEGGVLLILIGLYHFILGFIVDNLTNNQNRELNLTHNTIEENVYD